jgi:hypothetical protein
MQHLWCICENVSSLVLSLYVYANVNIKFTFVVKAKHVVFIKNSFYETTDNHNNYVMGIVKKIR